MPLCFYAYNLGSGRILPAEHPHEDKLHHVAVEEEELCSPIPLRAVDRLHAAAGEEEEESGRRTYLRERSWWELMRCLRTELRKYKGEKGGSETHKEESISQKCVRENSPPYPPSGPLSTNKYFSYNQSNNNANEFVSRIRNKVEQLAVIADAQYVGPEFKSQYLHRYNREGSGGC